MANVVLIKNNRVVTVVLSVDADLAVLDNTAKVDDIYDPVTGTFTDPAAAPPQEDPPAEG